MRKRNRATRTTTPTRRTKTTTTTATSPTTTVCARSSFVFSYFLPLPSFPLLLLYPAGFPDKFPWSEAARDLRVSRRLLAGTQRLNFRCNRLTAITFHQFGWRSLPIKYLRVARRFPLMDPMPLYPMKNHIIHVFLFLRFLRLTVNNSCLLVRGDCPPPNPLSSRSPGPARRQRSQNDETAR